LLTSTDLPLRMLMRASVEPGEHVSTEVLIGHQEERT